MTFFFSFFTRFLPRSGQKIKLFYLVDILRRETDEEHPLPANELCKRLAKEGITAERKAIYQDIALLSDYGFDIVSTRVPRAGYFLASREFELPEIYLLADAVRSAKFISAKKTRELIRKLDNMLSVYQARRRERLVYFDGENKCTNEEIYYTIDGINRAIEQKKKICLRYGVRRLGADRTLQTASREMQISPYAVTWQDDHYYLIGNYEKYDNLIHLRIDRISGVTVTEQPIRPFTEVCAYQDYFDVADYTKKLFGMYGGELCRVDLRCNRELIEQVVDRFGEGIFIRNVSETEFSFSVDVAISDGLVRWLLGYGGTIEVLAPTELRQKLRASAETLLQIYKEN